MKILHVFYDGECAMCQKGRRWFEQQPMRTKLNFMPYQSPEARQSFPDLDKYKPTERMVAISDDGTVYRGEEAWIQCLAALKKYGALAKALAHPTLKPFARRACALISENRLRLSRLLIRDRNALRATLESQIANSCQDKERCGSL